MQYSCVGSEMLKNRENNNKNQKQFIYNNEGSDEFYKRQLPNTHTRCLFQMHTQVLALHHAL